MTIGEKILKLRKQNNMSQEELAEKLEVSRQAVSKWEQNTALPTGENLQGLCKTFEINLSYLLDENLDTDTLQLSQPQNKSAEDSPKPAKKAKNRLFTLIYAAVAVSLAVWLFFTNSQLKNLSNQLESLKSYVYSNNTVYIPTQQPEEKRYTDYNCRIKDYDRENNQLTFEVSVTPLTFSENVQAEIVIKGKENSVSQPAQWLNGSYNSQVIIPLEDSYTVYIYLTDNGQTEIVPLESLYDMIGKYSMTVSGTFEGSVKTSEGKVTIDGTVITDFITGVDETTGTNTIYPVKAFMEIYINDKLKETLPFSNNVYEGIFSDNSASKNENMYSDDIKSSNMVKTTFSFYEPVTKTYNISENETSVKIKIILTDNFGKEYSYEIITQLN